jgi:NAD(P)-dependent dehydrogenase (short-subunit alcohol dehydrogenase family)
MRLKDKVAIVVGAGQAPGATDAIGNGRATALLFAREGAKVLAVDRHLESAEETAALARAEGGEAQAAAAEVTDEAAVITEIETEAFDRIVAVNLRSVVYACKHALPIMRKQGSGAVVNISSTAALEGYPWVTYKATKAGMIAMTKQIAIQNAEFGVRANVILPGLMDTPMAVDRRAEAWGRPRAEVAAERDAKVPLGHMGTGWDVAYAALFLASDEAKFIAGVALPVDGGKTCRIG